MIKSILYKEWIKSRWILLIVVVAFIAVITYSFMDISQSLRVSGYNNVWEIIVQKWITYFGYIKYLPPIAAILLAVSQYVPEMVNKRLKLTLHLPMAESKIMLSMLLYGVVSLTLIFLLSHLIIYIGLNLYFPIEITRWNLASIQPWLLGGLISYLLAAWVCIEPVWKHRIFNSLVGILLVSLFYFDALPGAYCPFSPYLVIVVVLSITFSFYSLIRFKDGEQ